MPPNATTTLIRILYRYFTKLRRGIAPAQAAGEAAKAMELQFGISDN